MSRNKLALIHTEIGREDEGDKTLAEQKNDKR
jgi:hypothetical protein